jgi:translation initiation factor 4E
MSLIGEMLDPEDQVCGIVASCRPKVDRIQIWTRGRDDVEGINLIGKRIADTLGLEGRDVECMSLEFQVSLHYCTFTSMRY